MNFLARFLIIVLIVACAWVAFYVALWLFLVILVAAPFAYLFVRWKLRALRRDIHEGDQCVYSRSKN